MPIRVADCATTLPQCKVVHKMQGNAWDPVLGVEVDALGQADAPETDCIAKTDLPPVRSILVEREDACISQVSSVLQRVVANMNSVQSCLRLQSEQPLVIRSMPRQQSKVLQARRPDDEGKKLSMLSRWKAFVR